MTQAAHPDDVLAKLAAIETQVQTDQAEAERLLGEVAISVRSAIEGARKNSSGEYRADCAPDA